MLIDKAIVIQRKYSHSLFFENCKLEIAKSLLSKGRVYLRLARYDQAQELMKKAYEIRLDLPWYQPPFGISNYPVLGRADHRDWPPERGNAKL